jgi:hypothetical protein
MISQKISLQVGTLKPKNNVKLCQKFSQRKAHQKLYPHPVKLKIDVAHKKNILINYIIRDF